MSVADKYLITRLLQERKEMMIEDVLPSWQAEHKTKNQQVQEQLLESTHIVRRTLYHLHMHCGVSDVVAEGGKYQSCTAPDQTKYWCIMHPNGHNMLYY
jgi:hypothetical protein